MNTTMMRAQAKAGSVVGRPSLRRTYFGQTCRTKRTVIARNDLGEEIKEKTKDFVEETKKSSGLDERTLSNQAGNEQSPTFGTTDIKTAKGQELAEAFSPAGKPGGITSLVEITNGRAAMFAMLAAFGAELSTKTPVLVQIQQAPLLIAGTFLAIIFGSAVPVLRGGSLQQDGVGPFTAEAEVINGRIGMAAFALLIMVETFKAGPGLVDIF